MNLLLFCWLFRFLIRFRLVDLGDESGLDPLGVGVPRGSVALEVLLLDVEGLDDQAHGREDWQVVDEQVDAAGRLD